MKNIKTLITYIMQMLLFASAVHAQRDTIFIDSKIRNAFFLVHPNPSPANIIKVNCPHPQCVKIKVYDMARKEISVKMCADTIMGMLEIEIDPLIAVSGDDFIVEMTEDNRVYAEKLLIRK